MAELDNVLSAGFGVLLAATAAPTLTANGVTRACLSTPVNKSNDLKASGFWLAFKAVCELTRADFLALQLKDRTPVLYQSADATQSIRAKVVSIEGEENDGDPCVRVTIEKD